METLTGEQQPDDKADEDDALSLPGTKVLFVADADEPPHKPAKNDADGEDQALPGTKVVYVDTSGITVTPQPKKEGDKNDSTAQNTQGTRAIYLGAPFGTNLGGIADLGTNQSFWMSQARSVRAATRPRLRTAVQVGKGGLQRDAVARRG